MCLSVPAKVVSVKGKKAQVEVYTCRRQVYLTMDEVIAAGDWVLVYGSLALSRLESKVAQEMIELLYGLTATKKPVDNTVVGNDI